MYTIDNKDFSEGIKQLNQLFELQLEFVTLQINTKVGISNSFSKNGEILEIQYVDRASFYRMLVISIKTNLLHYNEKNDVERRLTYMLDCSRNAVINPSSAKRLIAHLCVFGYRELSLYTEDTYEVEKEPCFGYMRGRFSEQEMQEIIQFADMLGMTVSLSIQCLAHMRSIYRYETYYKEAIDCNDVLMVGSERVKTLLENMFASIAKMLPSKIVNIGMDEPFMLGRGKHLNEHGYVQPGKLFLQQLKTVVEIAEKYGMHLRMWGDGVDSHYENRDEIAAFVKEHEVKVLFWGYGGVAEANKTVEQNYNEKYEALRKKKEFYSNCCYALSDHKYFGLAPHNKLALHIAEGFVKAAIDCNFDEIWLTSWGDCGAEVSPFAALPAMACTGYLAMYDESIGSFEEYFNCLFGSLQAFLKLDYANCLNNKLDMHLNTSSKYFLYQDVFMGVMDKSVRKEFSEIYASHIQELQEARMLVPEKYMYLFDTQIRLLEVLLHKHNLGNLTREAFSEGNKEELLKLLPIYQDVIDKVKAYFSAFRSQWYQDNKVFGFEIQEARIGALIFRMENCMERLQKYCLGEIECIPELNEEVLDLYGNGNDIIMLNWGELISAGVMIEYFSFV